MKQLLSISTKESLVQDFFSEMVSALADTSRIEPEFRFGFSEIKPDEEVIGTVNEKIKSLASLSVRLRDQMEDKGERLLIARHKGDKKECRKLSLEIILLDQKKKAVWSMVWVMICEEFYMSNNTLEIRSGWKVVVVKNSNKEICDIEVKIRSIVIPVGTRVLAEPSLN